MKRIQIKATLVALVLGSTLAFAFKAAPAAPHKPFYTIWQFTGSSMDDPTDESLYVGVTSAPTCATGTQNICYIDAPANPSNPNEPNITGSLLTRVENHDTSKGDVFLKHN